MLGSSLLLTTAALAAPLDLEAAAERLLGLEDASIQDLDLPVPGEPGWVQVELGGLPFTLDLQPFSTRAAGYQVLEDRGGGLVVPADPGVVRTYRGVVAEDPGSRVTASVLAEGLLARIELSNGDRYWVEPLAGRLRAAGFDAHALYVDDAVIPTPGRAEGLPWPGMQQPGPPAVLSVEDLYVSELACDADYEYFSKSGTVEGTVARIEAAINLINPEYEVEVAIRHELSTILVRTTPGGGGYTAGNGSDLLVQFRDEWTANQGHIVRDHALLFTDKVFGTQYGLGYVGVICNYDWGYAWVRAEYSQSLPCQVSHVAHMLAITWFASSIADSCYIMTNPTCCGTEFNTALTVPAIIAHRDTRQCLEFQDWVPLFVDDFESGDLATGGWSRSSGQRVRASQGAARTGQFGLRLRKGGQGTPECQTGTLPTWAETPEIDASGYVAIDVRFQGHFRLNDECEDLKLYWSTDGQLWQHFGTVVEHPWDDYSFSLPPEAAGQPGLRVRMVANAKGKNERAEIDGFCVLGR